MMPAMAATILRTFFAWLAAVIATSVLASILSTQFVLAGLQGLGVEISLAQRFSMTLADFGILPLMGMAVAACFMVGFSVATLAARFVGGDRTLWLVAAGAAALVAELLIMRATLGLMPVSGARTTAGLLAQGVAGGVGGWLFARLTSRRNPAAVAHA